MIYCIKYYRTYLLRRKFYLITDHKPLVWLRSHNDPNSRVMRWRLLLAEYDFEVIYRPGGINIADALSRNPTDEPTKQNILMIREVALSDLSEEQPPETNEGDETINAHKMITRTRAGRKAGNRYAEAIKVLAPRTRAERRAEKEQTPTSASVKASVDDNSSFNEGGDSKDKGETEVINIESFQPTLPDIQEEPELECVESESERENIEKVTPELSVLDNDLINFYPEEDKSTTQIIMCKEKLYMRKDNYLNFITTQGEQCDEGAKQLQMHNKLPNFQQTEVGVPKVIKVNKKVHIALPLRSEMRVGLGVIEERLNLLTKNLNDVLKTLLFESISIAKSETIENLKWDIIITKLNKIFEENQVKLITCLSEIRYALPEERNEIITTAHTSVEGGHRGVTKTIKRIRNTYQWEKLKEGVQSFIRKCLECETRKLIKIKTKMPLKLTSDGDSAMDVLAIDCVGPLPPANGYTYIVSFQCLLTKFAIAVPHQLLRQHLIKAEIF